MNHATRRLLSPAYFQRIASASRHQLRTRRPRPLVTSNTCCRICSQHRTFKSSTRLWQNKDDDKSVQDGPSFLPGGTTKTVEIDHVQAASKDPSLAQQDLLDYDKTEQKEDIEVLEAIVDEIDNMSIVDKEQYLAAISDKSSPSAQDASDAATDGQGISSYFGQPEMSGESNVASAQMDSAMATILGHGESEAHRDLREYARLAAWELPLLHKLKKPFQPPTSATPLRFRYTSYMGDEHPASKKVVVEFKPTELSGLNEQQQIKLIKLVGSRFNPEKQIIKMSCESFETPAQNKRYLGDLVQKLVAEAKNSKDMFKDLPIDLRHHKQKPIYKFPEEWKIERPATIVRGKTIRGKGRVKRETVQQLQESGNLVDGVQVIKEAMAALPRERLTVPAGGKQSTVLGTRTGRLPARRGQQTGWAPSW